MPIGEANAIALIARTVGRRNREIVKAIGDDAALYRDGLVVTTDAYLEGVHFDRCYLEPSAIGGRAVCGTLSDIAAMCARPIGVFVSLLVPPAIPRRELRELYRGMDAVCSLFNTEVAGGDIVASPRLGLALTALGRTRQARLRSSARPGDWVYQTGNVALAETGRLALAQGLNPARYRRAIERHVCPIPRINESLRLAQHIRALIDMSDGLSTDAGHIASESRVKVVLDYGSLPVAPETNHLGRELGLDVPSFVLQAGEDYELLFTSQIPDLETRVTGLGIPLSRIGRVEVGTGVYLIRDGRERRLRPTGYDHLTVRHRWVPSA